MAAGSALSVAMIVRDEAQHLADAVASVRPLAKEIVVLDTGSTDGTQALARELGCTVHEAPWPGDFAAARNMVLARCAYPWIFVLDGDECLGAEDHEAFARLLQGPPAGWRFTTRNYTDDTRERGFRHCLPGDRHCRRFAGWTPSVKVRLFPNRPEARFTGAVHELINPALEALGIPIQTTPIPVHHYAEEKNEDARARKHALYLALGQRKAAEAPGDPRARAELGHQCLAMGDLPAALRAYKAAAALAPDTGVYLAHLGGALFRAGRPDEARNAYRLAAARTPDDADTWRNLGMAAAALGAWEEALQAFERAAALRDDDSEAHRGRALALHHLGHDADAATAADRALTADPANREALTLYAGLMEALGLQAPARARLEALHRQYGALPGLPECLARLQ